MKKLLTLIAIIMITTSLFACTETQETEETYIYNGESEVNVDDRYFELEDIPENIAEETVIKDFLYTITADFDNLTDILGDIKAHRISLENEKKNYEEGVYIQSYIIHKVSTLTEEEYNERKLDNGEYNPLFYFGWEEIVDEYDLIEFKIVNVNFTQTHSEKSIELGPQWGDGKFSRNFLVGKTTDDDTYKIYDYGMM